MINVTLNMLKNEAKIRMLETSFRSIIIEHHQMLVIVVIIIVEISPWEARSRFSLLEFLNLDHYLLLSLHHQHLLLSESSDQNQIQHCQHQPANNKMYNIIIVIWIIGKGWLPAKYNTIYSSSCWYNHGTCQCVLINPAQKVVWSGLEYCEYEEQKPFPCWDQLTLTQVLVLMVKQRILITLELSSVWRKQQ